jgi:hypothetical protein
VGVRASTGGRFALGGANGERRGSVANARAREEGERAGFIPAGGRLGASEVKPVTHARVEGRGMAGDVRRSGDQWRATGGASASGLTPPGMTHLPRTAWVSSRRRSAATDGRSGASACAPDAGTERTAAC